MRTGLHCNTIRDHGAILDYYSRAGSKVVKLMDFDAALLNQLRARGITIIGREYFDSQPIGGSAAKTNIQRIVNLARQFPQVDLWEGYNEEHADVDDIGRYAEWEIERMRAFDNAGLRARCLIGCFSCGTPALPDDPDVAKRPAWERFRSALSHALAQGHGLALHEYSGPYMQWLCGANQWDWAANRPARIDDPCTDPRVEGWLTMRYRKAWRMCMTPWGLGELPLYITEGGVDDTWPRPGPQGKGYKDFANTEWAGIPGIGDYAQQRRWYMTQVSRDRYVRGVVDFGWDSADPTWRSFDLKTDPAMVSRIITAEHDLPVGHFGDTGGGMTDIQKLAAEAQANQKIQFNPGSALHKAAVQRGLAGPSPNSGEWRSQAGAFAGHQAQRFEWPNGRVEVATWNPATGKVAWTDITAIVT